MTTRYLLLFPLLLIFVYGCSSQPVVPDRNATGLDPEVLTFQLAVCLADPGITDPFVIPDDVPIHRIVKSDNFPLFASIALAAFDVYYEPSDWDDYLVSAKLNRGCRNYEPSDWDDYLESISLIIDPMSNYEPSDWDDWLVSGNYEPSDWDDYLINATLGDLADLN